MTARDADPAVARERQVVQGAFGGGYLVRGGAATAPDLVAGWPTRTLGALTYHVHPRAQWGTVADPEGPGRVVLLGTPVDLSAGVLDVTQVCATTLQVWRRDGHAAAVRYLAYLGGRWTAVLEATARDREPARVTVVPDCQATQAVFYSTARGIALGSQPALVAAAVGSTPDPAAETMWATLREARAKGVIFLPGTLTTHRHVLPLVPNHQLDLTIAEGSAQVRHTRFWPFQDRVERTDTSAVVDEFIDHFREHTRLLCQHGRTVLSLTAGLDSRTSLVGALPHLGPESFTFTYLNPRDGYSKPGAADDVFVANALAHAVGVPHRVLRWRQPAPDGVFDEIVRRTYPVQPGSVGAAHAMWADLPADVFHLQSIGAELGTTFYTRRPDVPITPAELLHIVTNRADLPAELAHEAFGDYLDYAQFTEAALGGYDFRDVFYWEQRMGKWGYRKYQDGDFSHRMLLPFNSRRLIEIMQSLPYRLREEKVLLRALLSTVPALADTSGREGQDTLPGWREVLAARPHLRPRLRQVTHRVRAKLPGRRGS